MLYSIIGILVIILDQLVKYFVDQNINWSRPVIELIPNVISLVRVQNDGAAFSFLSGGSARIWFILLTAIFAILVVIALATNFVSGRFGRWCLVFITAGGLSNMIDRIRFGYVIDMFRIDMFDFAVFNVADIFITVFCIAFILYILFGGEKERDDGDEFEEDEEEDEELPPPRRSRSSKRSAAYDFEEEEEVQPRRTRRKAAEEEEEYEERPVVRDRPRREQREAAVAPRGTVQRNAQNRIASEQKASASRTRAQKVAEKTDDALFEEMFGGNQDAATAAPARRQAAPAQTKRTAAARNVQTEDPFADWERANARASAANREAYNRAADTVDRVKAAAAETDDAFSDFLSSSAPKKAVKAPAQKAAPAKPKAAPVVSSSDDDFDLDSILNEFK